MGTLADFRQQYPQYNSIPDDELAERLYSKHYAGKIPREEFDAKLGLGAGTKPEQNYSAWEVPVHAAMNFPKDAGNVATQFMDAASNWRETLPNIPKFIGGAYQKLIPGEQKWEKEVFEPGADAIGKSLGFTKGPDGQHTWDWEDAKREWAERPAQSMLNTSVVVPGPGGLKAALNPLTPAAKVATVPLKAAGRATDKVPGAAPITRGLNPRLQAVRELPTTAEFKKRANDIYSAAEAQQVTFTRSAWRRLIGSVNYKMNQDGYHPARHPDAARELKILQDDLANGRVSFRSLEQTRSELGAKARDLRKQNKDTDARQLELMQKSIDDFMDNAKASDVAGLVNPQVAHGLFQQARDVYKQKVKADKLDEVHYQAELAAGVNYTQAGLEHALRREYSKLIKNKTERKIWSKDEFKAIKEVAHGGRFARGLGKFAPTGAIMKGVVPVAGATLGGLGGLALGGLSTGAIGGFIGGLGLMGLGAASRAKATARTKSAADTVQGVVRGGNLPPARHPLERPLASGAAIATLPTRQESLDHAESVLSKDVLGALKKSPNTRGLLNDWLKARASGQGAEEATQMLASAIMSELKIEDPTVYDRIIQELNQARGP